MAAKRAILCVALIFALILSTLVPNVKAWEKADFEIFDLVDELEKSEGKDTNFYNWLKLKPSATQAEVSKAYRKLSIQLHPDKNKQDANAEERFARLGKVAAILRNSATRERYNHFYKNGVPRWRGTGYYYARFRPGVGGVIAFVMVVVAGMQYLAKWINFYQEKRKIIQFVQDARSNLNVSVPKGYGAPTLGRSYLELGHRTFRCEIKSDHYIIIHTDKPDEEPVHLNTEWVMPPRPVDLYLIKWPLGVINKVLGRNDSTEKEYDDDNDTDSGNNDNEQSKGKDVSKKAQVGKKKKSKTESQNVTGTKVGGRRRAVKK
ncbi:DnaJ domain-containing protein [Absidia repens]|uniref:DnaJ domain-containing protein n=1 Tax=Absidia repens TaxID=90262 RepID=A0A1X2IBG1_9FUNG|nr:DnaJ domain-containing protein [Absidia repens]